MCRNVHRGLHQPLLHGEWRLQVRRHYRWRHPKHWQAACDG
jgi:hypothetical protein